MKTYLNEEVPRSKWTRALVVLLCLTLAILASACQSQTPQAPQVIRYMIPGEPKSLDPAVGNETYANAILYHQFEALVREDAQGTIQPAAAASWTISEDRRTYTFHLREDALWSDGKPVTAHDFAFAWLRLIQPDNASGISGLLTPYIVGASGYANGELKQEEVGIKALDETTFQVSLLSPVPYFMEILTFSRLGPGRSDRLDQADWMYDGSTFVSNGPYVLDSYQAGQGLVLVKNQYYYGAEAMEIDEIHMRFRQATDDIGALYDAGQLDVLYEITVADLRQVPNSEPDTHSEMVSSTAFVIMNHESLGLADERLRRALNGVIARQEIIDKALLGSGVASQYLVPLTIKVDGQPFHDFIDLDGGANMEEALDLMDQLEKEGLLPDRPLRFVYMSGRDDERVSLQLAEAWRSLGLEIETIGLPWTEVYNSAVDGDYDLAMMGWTADYAHPMTFLETFQTGAFFSQFSRWASPEYDQRVKNLALLDDQVLVLEELKALEQMILEPQHIIPVYHRKGLYIVSSRVKGWFRNTSSQFDFTDAWIED